MSVNANKLRTMRDRATLNLSSVNLARQNATTLTLVVALNVLLRVADADDTPVKEIGTLTDAGRILVDNYEKIYEQTTNN